MTHLPVHPFLRHPHTGQPLRAVGWFRGQPMWPVMGASPDDPKAGDPPADPPAEPPKPPAGDPPAPKDNDGKLGEAGQKALAAEREARKAAEKELAKYRKAEQDKADADKTEAEKRAAAESRAAAAELRALRLEVAAEKGLTPAQAKRLVGSNREELEKDADEILTDFPAAAAPAKGTPAPKPDPTQGPRGDAKARPTSLGQAVSSALSKK